MKRILAFIPYLLAYRWEVSIGIIALLATDFIGLAIPWILKNFIDLLPHKVGRQLGDAVARPFPGPVDDHEVPALDVAEFAHALNEPRRSPDCAVRAKFTSLAACTIRS